MADATHRMYIDGQWTDAGSGATFEVIDPATSRPVARVSDAAAADVRRAIDAAHRAFGPWSARPAKERGRILHGLQARLESETDAIAGLIVRENGKPFEEAKKEVIFALGYFGWFAEEARRLAGEWVSSPVAGKRLLVLRQPVGPVGAITPWNFPATMVTRKIAPALAAGCTVVLKPASATPLTALAIAQAGHDAGLPPGVLNVVTTSRASVAATELLSDTRIRKIGFTGSTDIGQWIMERAARQLTRLSFELGGNAPFIVFADADFDAAVAGAVAIKYLRVGGQSCICANRIYVQRGIAERFVSAFTQAVTRLRVAPGHEPGAEIGPLINEATRKKVHDLVEDARSRGARVLAGGHALTGDVHREGFFYAPTVLVDVADDMPVCREEIFGPVAPILVFDTEEEVLRRANDTTFGLAAYFYTRDAARLLRVAERLEYGLVGANDAAGYTHEIPFGGFKQSGLGREGGHQGLEEYTEVKSVVIGLG
ncbi:MAG TPA: NAD-dependent succinate-semialdehyde dehydrogenase [Methylomirabilota bacterium]|nr:NAD-dependent succinate-semialdehyde dehydrogenase [Methylomirabilota bacterium]